MTGRLVFQDFDSVPPGRKWREEILVALKAADLVMVFWCEHSRESDEVKREYDLAIEGEKDVVPVLLDSTPLPETLAEYQWVDFRSLAGPGHAKRRLAIELGNDAYWTMQTLYAELLRRASQPFHRL